MMSTCCVCGRTHLIHQPEFWPYRRGTKLYCSENCLIVDATKDLQLLNKIKHKRRQMIMARMRKDGTPAKKPGPKAKKVEIPEPLDGGPWEKMETPESITIEPSPIVQAVVKKVLETPEDEFTPEEVDMLKNGKIPPIRETARKDADVKPLAFDGLEISALRHQDLGEFYFDKKYNTIDWRTPEGDEVSLGPAWWKQMITDLPKIMKLLGVDP